MTKTTKTRSRSAETQDEIPQWLYDQLRADPELLRVVVEIVKMPRSTSPSSDPLLVLVREAVRAIHRVSSRDPDAYTALLRVLSEGAPCDPGTDTAEKIVTRARAMVRAHGVAS
jgi:hypothetical protein